MKNVGELTPACADWVAFSLFSDPLQTLLAAARSGCTPGVSQSLFFLNPFGVSMTPMSVNQHLCHSSRMAFGTCPPPGGKYRRNLYQYADVSLYLHGSYQETT